jgi:tetratricopeptide (TPR) repeat protein
MLPRATLLFLFGLFSTSALGCITLPGSPSGGSGAAATAGKRQPKPATLVAYGEIHERAATDPGRSPAEQEELRNRARSAYEQALQINPKDRPALLALARLYTSEQDYDRAVATYGRAITVYPKDAALRYELGMCYARSKNFDLGLQCLQMAVRLDPENRRYIHCYGLCLARAQRYEESFAVLARLEGHAQAHYDLGRMMHHLNQDEMSKEQLRLALAQNPELTGAQQLLAELERTTGPANPAASDTVLSPDLGGPDNRVVPASHETPQ